MDGFAVQSTDTKGAGANSPRSLDVIDTVYAGAISKRKVEPGTAIRIMTGAPVPEGADSIIMFEETDEYQRKKSPDTKPVTRVGIVCEAEPGLHIRRAGESIARGATVLKRGIIIRPSEVGVLASIGRSEVTVIRRPVVAILATGNELVDINQPLPTGKIYDSNTYGAAALVKRCGGIPRILGIALDREDSLLSKLSQGLDADMLITTGGVSAGDYDIVKDILDRDGELYFSKVNMKPGKPLAFGRLKGVSKAGITSKVLHMGLPGNPVSSMVTFELFARPAILKMMGKENFTKPMIEAVSEDSIENTDGRRIYTRVILGKRDGQYFAKLTGPQGSGIITSMSLAKGLAIVPEDTARIKEGDRVQVIMLDWNEEMAG
jgi:molybdopterin molybdotransferase